MKRVVLRCKQYDLNGILGAGLTPSAALEAAAQNIKDGDRDGEITGAILTVEEVDPQVHFQGAAWEAKASLGSLLHLMEEAVRLEVAASAELPLREVRAALRALNRAFPRD